MQGDAAMLVFSAVEADFEAEFNEWYNREHIDDLLALPDFMRGRRFRAERADLPYLAFYEGRTAEAFRSPRYLALLADLSPWSRKVIGRFARHDRMVYRRVAGAFHGAAGALALLRCPPGASPVAELAAAVEAAGRAPGCLGAVLLEADLDTANAPSDLSGLKLPRAERMEWAIAVQAMDRRTAGTALAALQADARLPAPIWAAACDFLYGRRAA